MASSTRRPDARQSKSPADMKPSRGPLDPADTTSAMLPAASPLQNTKPPHSARPISPTASLRDRAVERSRLDAAPSSTASPIPSSYQTPPSKCAPPFCPKHSPTSPDSARLPDMEDHVLETASLVSPGSITTDIDDIVPVKKMGLLRLAPEGHDYEVPETDPETTITVVANTLKSLCEKNDERVVVPEAHVDLSCFYSIQKQDFDVEFYVRRVFKYVDTTPNAFVNTLVYLDRLERTNELLKVNSYNVHRMLLTSVVLATKFLDDLVYSNKHYATVGGVGSTQEMNQLELTMLKHMNFRLHVDLSTHTKYQKLFFDETK